MLSKENERLIFSSFNQNKTLFIGALNTMIFDASTPGNQSQKLVAAQDILALISEINNVSQENGVLNKKKTLIDWFNAASEEGKALLINATRYVHEEKYISTTNNLNNIKNTIKSIEQLKDGNHCNYGYGYGLSHGTIDFDEIFG